jgi:hypothetical protein
MIRDVVEPGSVKQPVSLSDSEAEPYTLLHSTYLACSYRVSSKFSIVLFQVNSCAEIRAPRLVTGKYSASFLDESLPSLCQIFTKLVTSNQRRSSMDEFVSHCGHGRASIPE